MNERVKRIVEYNRILELLAEHATSGPGRDLCLSLEPMRDVEDIEKAQGETEAAIACILKNGAVSFGSNRDFKDALRALAIGVSLSNQELLHLAGFLENIARVKSYGGDDESSPLFDLFDCLYPLHNLSAEIRRCILSEDVMADDASPELKRIRRSIAIVDDRIHVQLNRMLNVTYAGYLQESLITVRGDRYCLPIKSEYKTQVRGIVHDQSSTGSTLFIEPAAIVEMGNEIRTLQAEEKREMEKVLAAISAMAAEHLTELKDDCANMTSLDFIFAKANLALVQNASRPRFNAEHRIVIRRGRHPLIDPKKVVPINLSLGPTESSDYDMIVITGPNTGGKTVTLKTVGLFVLMGESGLQIPAGDGSELSVFREVYADIGDEQSIEQSLSTFSAHMSTIVDILRRADRDCLCLFDELGSGTDPTEGAALAISILNFLHVRHITTLATTHYAELKLFAMRTPGIVNASCEFDVESLQPTYRLLIGVPGKSNAFAISQKLGLPGYIIETAKEQISQESRRFEDVLADLETTRQEAERQKEEAKRVSEELEKQKKSLEEREKKLEEQRQKILNDANLEAMMILDDARETAASAISELRKSQTRQNMDDLERTRQSLRKKAKEKSESIVYRTQSPRAARKLSASDLRVGDTVHVTSMGVNGIVTSLPDKQGKLSVRCGILNSQVSLSDLALVEESTGAVKTGNASRGSSLKKAFRDSNPPSSHQLDFSRSSSISPEINLLGKTTDEALLALDKYLDEARMSHLDSVRVIHGKGTGALRNAVQNYLRKQKAIRSYRAGDFGEGDAGVTIVYL